MSRLFCYVALGLLFGLGLNWPDWAVGLAMVVGFVVRFFQDHDDFFLVSFTMAAGAFLILGLVHIGHFSILWTLIAAASAALVLFMEACSTFKETPWTEIHG